MVDLPPLQYVLRVRRLGFGPATARVQVSDGDTVRLSFILERNSTKLDTVVVEGRRLSPRFTEFEDRRRAHAATESITRDDILKANPFDTWPMLSRVPAMNLMPSGANGALLAVSTRGMKVNAGAARLDFRRSTTEAVRCARAIAGTSSTCGG